MRFCLEQYLARCKVSDDLAYVISFDVDFEALTTTCNKHLATRTNTVFVHVISYRYGENAAPAPALGLLEDARHNAAFQPPVDGHVSPPLSPASSTGFEDLCRRGALQPDASTPGRARGSAWAGPFPSPAPTAAAGHAAPHTASVHVGKVHCYIVAVWPGHAEHVFTHDYGSVGALEESSIWSAVAAAPSAEDAAAVLIRHAPRDWFLHGATIMKNKQTQLAMARPKSKLPHYPLESYRFPPLDLSKSVLLCGAADIGKTCFARSHSGVGVGGATTRTQRQVLLGAMLHPILHPYTCFARSHFKFPYVMKTLDQLKEIPGNCDGLIFDDMRFDKDGLNLTPEEILAVLDVNNETAIKCRHYDGVIPALPRTFTSNLGVHGQIFPRGASRQQQDGIDRRYHIPLPFIDEPVFLDEANVAKWMATWRGKRA